MPDILAVDLVARDLHLHRVRLAVALVGQADRAAWMRSHLRNDVLEVLHRVPVDGQDAIARLQTRARRGTIRQHLGENRWYRRLPELKAQAREEVGQHGQTAAHGRIGHVDRDLADLSSAAAHAEVRIAA